MAGRRKRTTLRGFLPGISLPSMQDFIKWFEQKLGDPKPYNLLKTECLMLGKLVYDTRPLQVPSAALQFFGTGPADRIFSNLSCT